MKLILIFCSIIVCSLGFTVPFRKALPYRETLLQSINQRIVNGYPATANQIPYQTSILSPAEGGYYICGGSIISSSYVLTAAHCVYGLQQFILRFGTLNLVSGGTVQTSVTFRYHSQYNPQTLNNDVAVIQIPTALTFNDATQSIRLATLAQKEYTFIGVQKRVSGWGQTELGQISETLNWVWMNAITNAECAAIYGPQTIVSHVICARGWSNVNQGHCSGDSGGPLATLEGSIWTLIGVVSFGALDGCTLGYPHGYMRTSYFAEWVQNETGVAARP